MASNRFIPLLSSQSGAVPTASALFPGELAVNIADGKLFTRSGSAILLLNDVKIPDGVPTSSAQIIGYISGSTITPHSVQSDEFRLNAGSVSLVFTGSVNTGIFGATEYVYPFIPTSSYVGATVEYAASRPGGIRVGILMAAWQNSQITVTDISSTDAGDTADINFSLVQDNGYMKLRVQSAGSGSYPWTVQSIFKLFPAL
jgi:hypothetical protein